MADQERQHPTDRNVRWHLYANSFWVQATSHDVRLLTATDSIDPATGKIVPPERYDAAILMPWPMVAQLHEQLGRVLAQARGETPPAAPTGG